MRHIIWMGKDTGLTTPHYEGVEMDAVLVRLAKYFQSTPSEILKRLETEDQVETDFSIYKLVKD